MGIAVAWSLKMGFLQLFRDPTSIRMSTLNQQRTQKYLSARQQHPAWLLLASRRAPLMLSCLEALFEHQRDGVPFDTAVQALADMLAAHANHTDFEIETDDVAAQARRELREWIRRKLVTELCHATRPPHDELHGLPPGRSAARN
jgi:Protein of unknown function (DUF3375)